MRKNHRRVRTIQAVVGRLFRGSTERHHAARLRFRCLIEGMEDRCLLTTLLPGFQDNLVASNVFPTAGSFAPDGRFFEADKTGKVNIVVNDQMLSTPFLQLSTITDGEHGLVGLALDPGFSANGYVYVYYTHPDATSPNGGYNRLSRFTASATQPNLAVAGSELVLLDGIDAGARHTGGAMAFGADGMLYIGIGDGGFSTNAQDLGDLHGKVLRLDVDHYDPAKPSTLIPADNPFVGQAGRRGEIWAYGFRNPFSGAMIPGTSTMLINDVGSISWEEIDRVVKAGNYGWPDAEGMSTDPQFINPIYTYSHNGAGAAITGGAFYTGNSFPLQYHGLYFFEDYVNNWIKTYDLSTGTVTDFASDVGSPNQIYVGPDGSLYYFSLVYGAATIRKISAVPGNRAPQAVVSATPTNGLAPLTVAFTGDQSSDPDNDPLTYQWDFGDGTASAEPDPVHTYSTNATYSVTLTVNDRPDGSGLSNRSQPMAITVGNRAPTGTILSPASTLLYDAGQVITLDAAGTDPEDGALPQGAFTWSFLFGHNTHFHPSLPPIVGTSHATVQLPLKDETDPDQYYRIFLTVTDSGGLQQTTYVDIRPHLTTFTLKSNVPGVTLNLDGIPTTTPATTTGVVNMPRTLVAPPLERIDGVTYRFDSWSDGGAQTHDIATSATPVTYTATYVAVGRQVYLSDLDWTSASTPFGPPKKDESFGGNAILVNDITYPKGLGTHSPSEIHYALAGAYTTFTADIGLDDEVYLDGTVTFQVWADGQKLYDSGLMTNTTPTKAVSIDVTGRQELVLITTDGGDNNYYDHADWANAQLSSTYLSDLNWMSVAVQYGVAQKDRSIGGNAITLDGQAYAKGLGLHSYSEVHYQLNQAYNYFTSDIGVDDEVASQGSVDFQVWADGAMLFDSGVMTGSTPRKSVAVSLIGKSELVLITTDGGDNYYYDHADWADARVGYDVSAPTIVRTTPMVGGSGFVKAAVTATFGQQMDAATISSSTVYLLPQGSSTHVPATVTYDPASRTVKLQPGSPLAPEATYVAVLRGGTDGVKDWIGNTFPQDYTWSFVASPNLDLSDLNWTSAVTGYGAVQKDHSLGGQPLTINGTTYPKGIACHANSEIHYALGGQYNVFSAAMGIDDEVGPNGTATFQVWADGVKLYDSGLLTGTSPVRNVAVNVAGRQDLALITTDGGDNNYYDHTDWAAAQLGYDTTPPTVSTTAPVDGQALVPISTIVTATFSEAIDPSTLTTANVTLVPQGSTAAVPTTLAFDDQARTLTIAPSTSLANGVTYVVTIKGGPGGVADVAGNPLASNKAWTFATIPTDHLVVAADAGSTAGAATSFTVTADDSSGNPTRGYLHTIHFTSSDPQVVLPADYTFTLADGGVRTFSATFKTAGAQTITATDIVTATVMGKSGMVAVVPAAASRFGVVAASVTTAGTAVPVRLTAYDPYGNVATGYTGNVHFTSTDPQATLPGDYAFTAADAGIHGFSATLKTAGNQTVTVADPASAALSASATIGVSAAAASVLAIGGLPSTTTAGATTGFTATARDAYGNAATGYTGTVHFTSSDSQSLLPTDYTFKSSDGGTHAFTAVWKTAGSQTITAADTASAALRATSTPFTVRADVAVRATVGAPSTATAGTPITVKVTLFDVYGNVATGYLGTVRFSSNDSQAVLPSNYTFTAADAGTHSFPVTFKQAGSRTVSLVDTVNTSIVATSPPVTVAAAVASRMSVDAPAAATVGLPFSVTVTFFDAYGNIATGYFGTVHFSSNDRNASLPVDYTFTAGDAGVHVFVVTLKTSGSRSITVQDVADRTLGATSGSIKVR